MEKTGSLAVILVILCLLVGGTVGYLIAGDEIVYEEKIVEVPTEIEVEKIIEKEIEIISTDTQPLLDNAISIFLEEVEDEEYLQSCDDNEYDEEQIKVKKIYDEYSLEFDEEDYSVIFSVKLKYLDGDIEEKCYNTFDVEIFYEEDENPEVIILE